MARGYSKRETATISRAKGKDQTAAARYFKHHYSTMSQKAKEKQIAGVLEAMKILSGKDNSNAAEKNL